MSNLELLNQWIAGAVATQHDIDWVYDRANCGGDLYITINEINYHRVYSDRSRSKYMVVAWTESSGICDHYPSQPNS